MPDIPSEFLDANGDPDIEKLIALAQYCNKPVTVKYDECECKLRVIPTPESVEITAQWCNDHAPSGKDLIHNV